MKGLDEVLRFYKLETVTLEKVVRDGGEYYLVPADVLEYAVEAIFGFKYLWVSDPGTAAYIDHETDRIILALLTGKKQEE